ncbi:uncharacterized protein LOC132936003 [Metopolophium dirhodum]|uniref:uncharacterized protein LOC132936003 n=1 Tax=Metopolophium dirhodum TaxID=44670 RepID=UPI00298F5392|nr:uncharacterized protein LOC132936003 [Metopolophium dirhodum]XP_060858638.1 uncharacterized protein LOC132936003 [Metopolophium dirhodum]XP_060858639.1 uncharacterized protein LOC132936003 [Metopolophium dirhodum]XP_060858640.1 uncharacterized protein LOC132936003 [Metopolophium dirhodum]
MENSYKRPLENGCQYLYTETKKPKASQVTTTTSHPKSSKEIVGFQDLSDDVIMYLFKYLSHDNLAKMALICPNLLRVSHDWTLWKKPKFEKFEKSMEDVYLSYLKEDTTELLISCNDVPSSDFSVSHKFLIQLETKCPELLHLTLTNQVFDAREISVKILHRKLKMLTIDNTTIENIPDSSSYLCDINNACPDLEQIIITNNGWFMPNCLYALSKLERLLYLSLAGCKQFKICIPYAGITAIIGFKSLQTLDLRFTPVSDHELVCFQRLTTLKNVLLESPEYMNHERDATITDLGLAGFCTTFEFLYPYIQILIDRRNQVNLRRVHERCRIETLYVRNYPKVTDAFLKTAVRTCPELKMLDITGSCCTLAEIENFKANRPGTKVIC